MATQVSEHDLGYPLAPTGPCSASHSLACGSWTRSRETLSHLVAAWDGRVEKRWFDFCYRFAVCVKPGYLSPRTLNRCPLGSATDFLTTITAAHPPSMLALLCVCL
jgi:hypothetical protein